MRSLLRTVLCLTGLGVGGNAAAVMLTVDAHGQLLSAWNVDVNGQLLDVEFLDGSCIDVFSGCTEPSDIFFQTLSDAVAASQALLNQVFLDGLHMFDTDPTLTAGCETASLGCGVLTPYEVLAKEVASAVRFLSAANFPDDIDDRLIPQGPALIGETTEGVPFVWAVWSESPASQVTLTPTLPLAALALVLAGTVGRRRNRPT